MADGTSFALPMPKPTTPWPSPTTTSALKLRFLPPLTTFVTRLIDDHGVLDVELRRVDSLACSHVLLELQTGFARRVRHGANAPVIQEAAAVEHHALDALFDRPLGDRLADRLGALQLPPRDVLRERALQRRLDGRGRRPASCRSGRRSPARRCASRCGTRSAAAAPWCPEIRLRCRSWMRSRRSSFVLISHYFAPVLPAFFFSTSPV